MEEENKLTNATPKPKKKKGCLKGCLLSVLVFILAAVLIVGGIWKFVLNPGPGAIAKSLALGPVDAAATEAVRSSLLQLGIEKGVRLYVLPLPDEKGMPAAGNGSMIYLNIDLDQGYHSPKTEQEVRQQAKNIIGSIVEANKKNGANINQSGFSFCENDKVVASLSMPVHAGQAWLEGKLTDQQFLDNVSIKIHDIKYFQEVFREYLDEFIGNTILKKFGIS